MDVITTALSAGLGDIATEALKGMAAIVPVALPILGGFLLVKFGKRIYTTVTGR